MNKNIDSRAVKSLEVCIATMTNDLNIEQFLKKINIQSDVIIGNQCGSYGVERTQFGEHHVLVINTNEKGVGLNRNNAWMRTTADVVLFADDDMRYYDGYKEKVIDLFNRNPKADVIIFNIDEEKQSRKRRRNVNSFYTREIGYGAVRIAIRRYKAQMHGISFNTHFGGGTEFCRGEDTLFLASCVREKLKILVVPESIAILTEERESTWFQGYNAKYNFDTGVLLGASKVKAPILRILISNMLKKRKLPASDFWARCKSIRQGIRYYKGL